jgi:lactam utilization protein lamb
MITPRAPRVQGGEGSESPSGVAGALLKGVKDAGKAAGKVFTRGKGHDTETGHRRMLGR